MSEGDQGPSRDSRHDVPAGPLTEWTFEEAEQHFLERLAAAKDDPQGAMWNLAVFYKRAGKLERAFHYFNQLYESVEDREPQAQILMALGQVAEMARDFELAAEFYSQGLVLEPRSRSTCYYLHNNLGFSLNQLGRFREAEPHCWQAIEIDPQRHNAYKNLGISLAAMDRHREAAEFFVRATQRNAWDGRALGHLEDLLEAHPGLQQEFSEKLQECRRAVARSRGWRNFRRASMPRWSAGSSRGRRCRRVPGGDGTNRSEVTSSGRQWNAALAARRRSRLGRLQATTMLVERIRTGTRGSDGPECGIASRLRKTPPP